MQKVGRRGFLKFMGGAAVGGKQIAVDVAKQAGVTVGLGSGNSDIGAVGVPMQAPGRGISLGKWLLKNALPEWKVAEIRENSKRVHFLDPDLSALHSFSMAAKIGIQQQRNFERQIKAFRDWAFIDEERQAFNQQHDFWL